MTDTEGSHDPIPAPLDEAKDLGINISRAAEKGLAAELKAAREARWRTENRDAIARSNAASALWKATATGSFTLLIRS